jgi:class 3 adenylate cyclase
MPNFRPDNYSRESVGGGVPNLYLPRTTFDEFKADLLGLGQISRKATTTDAIAAVFDLEGFTNFSKQIEPHLAVPRFLNKFLLWIFEEIRNEMVRGTHVEDSQKVHLWCPLPFFVKFMGDGLLVLWDIATTSNANNNNIMHSCSNICKSYKSKFYPEISKSVVDPPLFLRCGVAMGRVLSVGEDRDFVGSCINMSARLEKLPGIKFAANTRGFELDTSQFRKDLVVTKVAIRGIGNNELIAIRATEFNKLSAADKAIYTRV